MQNLGYTYLIEKYDLDVCRPHRSCFVDSQSSEKVFGDGEISICYPLTRYSLGGEWQNHLRFAFKYEGVNLEILKALFKCLSPHEIEDVVRLHPVSGYSRRLWFLFEFLTKTRLNLQDVQSGNYIQLLNPKLQLAFSPSDSVRVRRYRIENNLPGTSQFCPMILLPNKGLQAQCEQLKERAEDLIQKFPNDLIIRSIQYLYIKETKSSYAIERETPGQKRQDAFITTLRTMAGISLNKDSFVELQNQIVDYRYAQNSWRTTQNYVGQTLTPMEERVHFISPKPEDIGELMDSYLKVVDLWLKSDIDAVTIAAVLSFAFVFLHPFDDGNGRIHRFLIHYFLKRKSFLQPEIVLPISAVLLKDVALYDRLLEYFSRYLMPHLKYNMNAQGEISVLSDSVDFYRYIDFTWIVQQFQEIVKRTIDTEWKAELNYLYSYDQIRRGMREIVDLPEVRANRLILFVQQNGGTLSARKRSFFAELTDEEISRLEGVIRKYSEGEDE